MDFEPLKRKRSRRKAVLDKQPRCSINTEQLTSLPPYIRSLLAPNSQVSFEVLQELSFNPMLSHHQNLMDMRRLIEQQQQAIEEIRKRSVETKANTADMEEIHQQSHNHISTDAYVIPSQKSPRMQEDHKNLMDIFQGHVRDILDFRMSPKRMMECHLEDPVSPEEFLIKP